MAQEFIYFFKHKNSTAVKIGKTSGDSVISRFSSFKTFCPYGAEILGFFKTENAALVESQLHKQYHAFRLDGEWFNLPVDLVESIISRYDSSYLVAKKLFNEWIADPKNNVDRLVKMLRRANETVDEFTSDIQQIINSCIERTVKRQHTTKEILAHIVSKNQTFNLTSHELARQLAQMGLHQGGFRRGDTIKKGYCVRLV